MFKLKNLPQEEQKSILQDCDLVKNGKLTEDSFYDKYFDKYGYDFFIPNHYLENYEYSAQEVKDLTRAMGTRQEYNKIKQEHKKVAKKPNKQVDFDSLLDDVFADS